ncbi:hypothetical protein [Flavilitoribacter nigricans]|uniref:Uncharacterized protein n=1 Tax=Flavilitoribacter nigricans (strain ATCC 23147 / DSM 23189 / NBRC 102662 / NCIMB 1420 / SS-2) TaxID=1122177 RepID=A0A2D0N759_FLAN2|nr:hypothetical protein [Flavilitoribacter nigricans]PHN04335.1 hypothetical protein CRP01_22500 [Flavilitoribacter nigricans DSM 23189 = NBRC 102662]
MTDTYYGYSKEVHELAKTYIERDIYGNASYMVEDFLKHNTEAPFLAEAGFCYDNIENLYAFDLESIEYFLSDHLTDEEMEIMLEQPFDEREAKAEELGYEPDPQEIYEWYLISEWLFYQLRDLEQPVLKTDYGFFWGRTATGQAMIMDGTFQKIAEQFVD